MLARWSPPWAALDRVRHPSPTHPPQARGSAYDRRRRPHPNRRPTPPIGDAAQRENGGADQAEGTRLGNCPISAIVQCGDIGWDCILVRGAVGAATGGVRPAAAAVVRHGIKNIGCRYSHGVDQVVIQIVPVEDVKRGWVAIAGGSIHAPPATGPEVLLRSKRVTSRVVNSWLPTRLYQPAP